MSRRKEDKEAIVAALEEQEQFWRAAQAHAPGRFSRLLVRVMRSWAGSGVTEFRRRIAEDGPPSSGGEQRADKADRGEHE